MNVKRFTARSSREALAMVRQALGEDAIVLSTKPSGDGVEVLAMAPESMQQIERMATDGAPAAAPVMSSGAPAAQARTTAPAAARQRPSLASRTAAAMPMPTETLAESSVDDDVARLNMSTLSFQDYVRERMLKRRQLALQAESASSRPALAADSAPGVLASRMTDKPATPKAAPAKAKAPENMPVLTALHSEAAAMYVDPPPVTLAHEPPVLREEVRGRARVPAAAAQSAAAAAAAENGVARRDQQDMMNELRSMKGMIEERFGALAFMENCSASPHRRG